MPRLRSLISILPVLLVLPTFGAATVPGAKAAVEPLRLSGRAFGETVALEVRDLAEREADLALRAAFARLREVERELAEATEALNDDASSERAVTVAPPIVELLGRAIQFCTWSQGAVGPLGGALRAHWLAAAGNPSPPAVPAELVATARCDRIALDAETGTVRVAAGSRVDLAPFAAGFAVDRTVDALREGGVGNGFVRIGRIERGFGAGPAPGAGRGWPAALPTFEGYEQPFDVVRLEDRALAVIWRAEWPPHHPLHVDQRTGALTDQVWAAAAVTELAIDAQALVVAGVVLGPREGHFRMAALEPEPSVLWLLGRGQGRPLRRDLNWSDLHAP